jgi:hypothetical protein
VGREAEFIAACAGVLEFNVYSFQRFLDQIPQDWRSRLAVKSALTAVVKGFCRRNCMEIAKSRYYEPLSFRRACELSGLPEVISSTSCCPHLARQ